MTKDIEALKARFLAVEERCEKVRDWTIMVPEGVTVEAITSLSRPLPEGVKAEAMTRLTGGKRL